MRHPMALVLAVLACSTGCDKVFRLDTVHEGGHVDADTDAAADSTIPDAPLDPRVVARFDFEGTLLEAKSRVPAGCTNETGCPTFVPGRHGMGIALDGVDACLTFTLPYNPTELTVAVWINTSMDIGQSIIAKPLTASGSNSFQIDAETNRTLRFITYTGSQNRILVEDAAFSLGAWQHIAVTFDGTKHVFVNGIPAANSTIGETMASDGSAMFIGCDFDTDSYVRYYRGLLDEVIVFDAALSQSEIAALAAP